MRAAGLYAISSKKYKAKQEKSEIKETKHLLLEPSNRATTIKQVWHSDITYVPTDEGWLYLAGSMDSFSKRMVGYAEEPSAAGSIWSQLTATFEDNGMIRPADGSFG